MEEPPSFSQCSEQQHHHYFSEPTSQSDKFDSRNNQVAKKERQTGVLKETTLFKRVMRRRRCLSLLLPLILLTGSASAWNFNFGTFGLDEDLILFHDFGTDFNEDANILIGLWNVRDQPSLSRN